MTSSSSSRSQPTKNFVPPCFTCKKKNVNKMSHNNCFAIGLVKIKEKKRIGAYASESIRFMELGRSLFVCVYSTAPINVIVICLLCILSMRIHYDKYVLGACLYAHSNMYVSGRVCMLFTVSNWFGRKYYVAQGNSSDGFPILLKFSIKSLIYSQAYL